jgi:hypothetical protein
LAVQVIDTWVERKGRRGDAFKVAVAAEQLIPHLKNPIDASIVSLRSAAVTAPWIVLRMFNFVDRPPECSSAPACIGEALADPVSPVVANPELVMALL